MERISRTTGRLGVLATPIVIAALSLALSACGSSAPSGTPATAGSPATSSTSASSDAASAAQFCGTWQQFKTTMAEMMPILDNIPAPGPSTAPASLLLPTLQGINTVLEHLDQEAPPAVSADMAAVTSYWGQVVADFQNGGTVAQAEGYMKAHPPANAATASVDAQQLTNYLATTCHISSSS
jgi:hypothetical protein